MPSKLGLAKARAWAELGNRKSTQGSTLCNPQPLTRCMFYHYQTINRKGRTTHT